MAEEKIITGVIPQFACQGALRECAVFGSGHINDTYRLTFDDGGLQRRYILQRMNRTVFTKPAELMENVSGVTAWLRRKIQQNGGDPERETLNLVPTRGGSSYYTDPEGEYWRVYLFIEGASCFDQVQSDDDFYQSAVAFGHFQRLLADYPAQTLHETIARFHDTPDRFRRLREAAEADVCGRAALVGPELSFAMEREGLAHALAGLLENGELPLRVTHNDTKLNNILIDDATGRAVCVIDLDTVMPGLSAYDFGDSIRFGASTGAEDERDLSKVSFDLHLYEVYVRGFVEGCAGALTERELDVLPLGAVLMTFECGIRFLTDYLEGDHYFKIHRPEHNLDRARTQFKLVRDMEAKQNEMRAIIEKYRRG